MSGREKLREVGRTIRAAAATGAVSYVTGTTTTDAAAGWVSVDLGSQVVRAKVPGSFRATVVAGQDVRLSLQGTLYTLDSILSALPTPATPTTPSASTVTPGTATAAQGFTAAGYSNAGFTAQDFQAALYAEYLAGRLNAAIDVLNGHATDIANLNATVNGLRNTLASIQQALSNQGHIT